MKKKVILFDFWGTIVENGVFPSPVRQAKRMLKLRAPFSVYIKKFEEVLMTKTYTSLKDAFHAVADAFGTLPREYQIENLVGLWNKNRLLAKPFEETIEVLEDLKKDHTLVLITNTDCFSVEPILEKFDLDKCFSAKIFSYKEGFLKTQPELFKKALETVNATPEEAVMVGDSMETDICGAKQANVRAILVDRRDRRPFEDKVTNLRQLRAVIEKEE